ncbi:MAG: transglycosylase domain-containing protein [Oscillospiraceae bacterium]|nr:transglycosylase domain-containing protein [Oscillospiraceae bacterium]
MEYERNRREQSVPRKRKKRRSGAARGIFSVLGTLVLVGIFTGVMLVWIFMHYVDTTIKPSVQVRAEDYTMALSSVIYYQDRDTQEWKEYQTIHGKENRIYVDIEDMPDMLWKAAVAIEDERFFQHHGVDWKRTAGAVLKFFGSSSSTYGGSTITQQMLKNMTDDNKGTVNRKVREIFRALEFEKNYEKMDILELYLNTIYLGKGCYGVQTAAEYYFGKDVSELNVAECACLIAITNNPSIYGPMSTVKMTNPETGVVKTARELNKQRQENILFKMYDPKTGLCYLTEEEYRAACDQVLYFTDGSTSAEELVAQATGGEKVNDWFVEQVIWDVSKDLAAKLDISEEAARVKLYNSGYHIYTTMDPRIQRIAESVYEDRSNLDLTSRDGQIIRSGITIVEPSTGNIVAIVGDMGEKSGNLITSYATDRRQVGSSMKPLTAYAPAIDSGAITPATAFDDYPIQLLNGNPWPKNSPNRYRGWTSVTTGLQYSINTIALQSLQAGGLENAFAFATENLGLNLVPEDMNLSSLGLGGLTYGLNTVEMAAAYASFANNGVYNRPRTYTRVMNVDETEVILENESESHVAMKETTAYLMTKMLQNAVNAGTGTQAKFSGQAIAGKTGTTSDNYDRYFVGFTPYYSAAVWTGYRFNAKISYSGGNPAITMWKKVMQQIHEDLEYKAFDVPETGIERVKVCMDSGLLATDACANEVRGNRVAEYEVAVGTAPTESCTLHTFADYCEEGACLATEHCPNPVQKGVLSCERENYGPSIIAEDEAYTLSGMKKAIGLQPTIAGDGTETYPEVVGCPVHQKSSSIWPDWPDWPDWPSFPLDPTDPDYDPSFGGVIPVDPPTEPTEPADPGTPQEPGSGGEGTEPEGTDWWQNLVNSATGREEG